MRIAYEPQHGAADHQPGELAANRPKRVLGHLRPSRSIKRKPAAGRDLCRTDPAAGQDRHGIAEAPSLKIQTRPELPGCKAAAAL